MLLLRLMDEVLVARRAGAR